MLSITDISVRIAGRLLIDNSSVQIVPGARVGFVGRNGVGKSTLFHAIRGELPTESGSISIPPRWRIGSLAQEAPDGPESLIEVVLKADLERDALLAEAETAHDPLAHRRYPNPARRHRRAFGAGPRRRDPERPWIFHRRSGRDPARSFPAAGACASRWRRRCFPRPIFCCWTSPPTISISKARCGSRITWRIIRAP